MSEADEVSQQIMKLLESEETVHLRKLLQRLPYGLREIKRALERLEAEGAVESFRHGGYTFYRLAGRGEEEEEGGGGRPWTEPPEGPEARPEPETAEEGGEEGEEASAPEEAGQ